MMPGFEQAHQDIQKYLEASEQVKSNSTENRFIMLTDVTDNSIGNTRNFIQKVEGSSIHTTIIGISDSFRSEVCESLN